MKPVFAILILAASLRATDCATSGNTFVEDFTNGNSDCGDGTLTCKQLWSQTQGTSLAVGAAPVGFTSAKAAQMTMLATTQEIVRTYGSIPTIPIGNSYDVCFGIDPATATPQNNGVFLALSTNNPSGGGGSLIASCGFYSQSGWKFWCQGTTDTTANLIALPQNTVTHCVIHIDAVLANSSLTCGASGPYTFTAISNAFQQIYYGNITSSTAATIWLGDLYVQSSIVTSATFPPTMFLNAHGRSDGEVITVGNLESSTELNGCSWHIDGTGDGLTFSSTGAGAFPVPLPMYGGYYSGNTGLSYLYTMTTAHPTTEAICNFETVYPMVVVGYDLYVEQPLSDVFTGSDFERLSSGNDSQVCGDKTPHTDPPTCYSGTGGASGLLWGTESTVGNVSGLAGEWQRIQYNTHYWITKRMTYPGSATSDQNSLYTGDGQTLLYTTPVAATGILNYWLFGFVGTDQATETLKVHLSNIIICLANCTFPLLPPRSVGGLRLSGSVSLSGITIQ